jgi:hypothetical protein
MNFDLSKFNNIFNKNNDLVNNLMNDVVKCDTDCQNKRNLNIIHQEYIKTNNLSNNINSKLKDVEKKYLIAKNGSSWYLNYLEEKQQPEADEMVKIINNEMNNNINKINLLLDNYNTILKSKNLSSNLLNKYEQQNNYFNNKKDIIENSKNIASRKNYYDMNYFLFYKTLVDYINYLVWIIIIVFIYLQYIKPRLFNRNTFIKISLLILFIYSLSYISKKISILYQSYMIKEISNYKELEYKIEEAKDL